jgi:histidinol dehydrogenase
VLFWKYTAQFDQIQLQTVQVQAEEVTKAVAAVPEELKQAIQNA